ncbi:hypothetical protein FACS1894109_14710 [Spirochaetia bacterium]|nr:hypothetical protein FACS1894109_14710 [Spirochaetia bacterium]
MNKINKVIVVFKTHLDVGFTGYAADILKKYRDLYIPQAVELAFKVNAKTKRRFVWTVGSYLIHNYLSANDVEAERKKRLEESLRLDYVRWHALACTTHTELMDPRLVEYDLSLSQKLDARYGKKTRAAKMTDVPGHTIALVPYLARAGVEYLHIGVNAASRVPEVPALFRWRYGGDETVVNYSGAYGTSTELANGVVLEFAHANDNDGPPSEEALDELYRNLAEKYPGAEIEAGSLDDFALAIREIKDTLPVVEEEISDTWIHGAASDPLKTGQLKKLLHLKDKWIERGLLDPSSETYGKFMEPLLLVTEHTWGMDCKIFLQDFTNWKKEDFQKARAADTVFPEKLSSKNRSLLASGNRPEASYSKFEASHREQRDYLKNAVAALPPELAREASAELDLMGTSYPGGLTAVSSQRRVELSKPLGIGGWIVTIGSRGQLETIKNEKLRLDRHTAFGLFSYELFDGKAADDSVYAYGRDLKKHGAWFEPDFGKAGLRYEEGIRAGRFMADTVIAAAGGNRLTIAPVLPSWLPEEYGCPREIVIEHLFEEHCIITTVYLGKKDANRIPEALWFGMDLGVSNPNRWHMVKIGHDVSPLNVVRGGNRKFHAVEALRYSGADGSFNIIPGESPLATFGGYCLYDVDDDFGIRDGGVNFLLYGNRWGTNFKQWFEEDLRFTYRTEFTVS